MLIYNIIKYGLLLLMLLIILILYNNNNIEYFDATTDNNFIFKQINNSTNDYSNYNIGTANNYKNNLLKIKLNFNAIQTSFYLDFIDLNQNLYLRIKIINNYIDIIDPNNTTLNDIIILNDLKNIPSTFLVKITPLNNVSTTDVNYKPLILTNVSLILSVSDPYTPPAGPSVDPPAGLSVDPPAAPIIPKYPKNYKSDDIILVVLSSIFCIFFLFKGMNKFSDMETAKINNFITL